MSSTGLGQEMGKCRAEVLNKSLAESLNTLQISLGGGEYAEELIKMI